LELIWGVLLWLRGDASGEGHDSPCPRSVWVPGSETLALSPPPAGFLRAESSNSLFCRKAIL